MQVHGTISFGGKAVVHLHFDPFAPLPEAKSAERREESLIKFCSTIIDEFLRQWTAINSQRGEEEEAFYRLSIDDGTIRTIIRMFHNPDTSVAKLLSGKNKKMMS